MTEADANNGSTDKGRWFGLNAGASNWLWLSAVVIVLDQWSKTLVSSWLELFESVPVLPILDIRLLHNKGAAFSLLADAGDWTRWFFTAIAVGVSIMILLWLRRLPAKGQGVLAAGLALILGGALGNVIDRAVHGWVIDFIHVHYPPWNFDFPSFNIADSAITIGAGLLILDSIIQTRRERRAQTGT